MSAAGATATVARVPGRLQTVAVLAVTAVVIGAMLLSPLMNPIIGTGFALATGDARWLRRCAGALGIGCGLDVDGRFLRDRGAVARPQVP